MAHPLRLNFSLFIRAGYGQAAAPYPYMRFPMKEGEKMGASLQEMDAERTVRRARRNRTCFTRQQVL